MSAILRRASFVLIACCAVMIVASVEAAACGCFPAIGITPAQFKIKIDGNTALKDLLPVAPKTPPAGKPILPRDLSKVPEIQFENHAALTSEKEAERIAHQLAAINHLNAKKADHFMEELLRQRSDLAGLPFTLGDACRHDKAQARKFSIALAMVKVPFALDKVSDPAAFWKDFEQTAENVQSQTKNDSKTAPYLPENRHIVAALMQIFTGRTPEWQVSLAQRLPSLDRSDTDKQAVTEALANLAVFAQDRDVREAALKSLEGRDTKIADAIVRRGLRYPWPEVARNSAELVVRLKRTHLAGEFQKMLNEPDPRAPVMQKVEGKKVPVVREVVRVNHLRNCMLCHPGVNTPDFLEDKSDYTKIGEVSLSGVVPIPGAEIPSGYGSLAPPVDILVRADATYLRQDFSLLEKVADAAPWPEMQRFDYLVRNRVLSGDEKAAFDALFASQANEYRVIAQSALRRLNEKQR